MFFMEYYRIMIVDDEEEMRKGIIKKIDWQANGFCVVGNAENGKVALEMAEQKRPDVIFTDIKMPFMDGLEFGEKIKKIMPSVKLVILSGFDDFEYAQKAIKINVTEYILKPINSLEFLNLLKKLKKQLDNEFNEKKNTEILRKKYLESLPIIKEQFYSEILNNRLSENQIIEKSELYNINFKSKFYNTGLVQIGESTEIEKELIPISVKKIIDETLFHYTDFVSLFYSDKIAIIYKFNSRNQIDDIVNGSNEICIKVKRILGISISIGIGNICNKAIDLGISIESAKSALDYQVILGKNKAIYIGDVEPDLSINIQLNEKDADNLLTAVKMGSDNAIETSINTIMSNFDDLNVSLNQYQIYMAEIITIILKMIRNYNIDMVQVFGKDIDCYSYVNQLDSLYDVKNWLIEICIKLSSLIKSKRVYSSKMLAENAKQYIYLHYNEFDLSVESLCTYLHVSPAYFSTIFKKETGMSFTTYLTNIRLEEAVKLLNTTDDKTYMIASKVGYSEPNYFSYVFKKHFGISPSKYRMNRGIK